VITRTALAESGLPVKYWADAVQTIVYTQNLLPNPRQPIIILAELWTGRHQDISYLQSFGCTSYTHVPLDLNQSKLNPRSVKTALLGYFGHDEYKLLNKSTGACHNLAKQLSYYLYFFSFLFLFFYLELTT